MPTLAQLNRQRAPASEGQFAAQLSVMVAQLLAQLLQAAQNAEDRALQREILQAQLKVSNATTTAQIEQVLESVKKLKSENEALQIQLVELQATLPARIAQTEAQSELTQANAAVATATTGERIEGAQAGLQKLQTEVEVAQGVAGDTIALSGERLDSAQRQNRIGSALEGTQIQTEEERLSGLQRENRFAESTEDTRRLRLQREAEGADISNRTGLLGLQRGEIALGREQFGFIEEQAKELAEPARTAAAAALVRLQALKAASNQAQPFIGPDNEKSYSEFITANSRQGNPNPISPQWQAVIRASHEKNSQIREERLLKAVAPIQAEFANQLQSFSSATARRNDIRKEAGASTLSDARFQQGIAFQAQAYNPAEGASPLFAEFFNRNVLAALRRDGVNVNGPFDPERDGALGYAIVDKDNPSAFNQPLVKALTRSFGRDVKADPQLTPTGRARLAQKVFVGLGASEVEAERLTEMVNIGKFDVYAKEDLSVIFDELQDEVALAQGPGLRRLEAADYEAIPQAVSLLQEARYREFVRTAVVRFATVNGGDASFIEKTIRVVLENPEQVDAIAFEEFGIKSQVASETDRLFGDVIPVVPTLEQPTAGSGRQRFGTQFKSGNSAREEYEKQFPIEDFINERRAEPPPPATGRLIQEEERGFARRRLASIQAPGETRATRPLEPGGATIEGRTTVVETPREPSAVEQQLMQIGLEALTAQGAGAAGTAPGNGLEALSAAGIGAAGTAPGIVPQPSLTPQQPQDLGSLMELLRQRLTPPGIQGLQTR